MLKARVDHHHRTSRTFLQERIAAFMAALSIHREKHNSFRQWWNVLRISLRFSQLAPSPSTSGPSGICGRCLHLSSSLRPPTLPPRT